MVAGASRVPFRTYLFLNIVGELVLVTSLLVVGYYFGGLYSYIADSFKIWFLVAGVLVIGSVIYGFSRYMKARIAGL